MATAYKSDVAMHIRSRFLDLLSVNQLNRKYIYTSPSALTLYDEDSCVGPVPIWVAHSRQQC